MNVKISVFVICVEVIIYLLLHNFHDRTFKFGKFLVLYLGCGQGRIQHLVWAHWCYRNVGFVYTNNIL